MRDWLNLKDLKDPRDLKGLDWRRFRSRSVTITTIIIAGITTITTIITTTIIIITRTRRE